MAITIGLTLCVLGILLIIAELATPGFLIGVAGTAMFVLGAIALVFGDGFFDTVWAPIFAAVTTLGAMYISVTMYKKLGRVEKPTTTVGDSLIGKKGIVIKETEPDELTKGKVRIESQIWSATSKKPIREGIKVEVTASEGVHVVVKEIRK